MRVSPPFRGQWFVRYDALTKRAVDYGQTTRLLPRQRIILGRMGQSQLMIPLRRCELEIARQGLIRRAWAVS